MDIKIVRKKLNQALEAPEDDFKYQAFVNDYAMLLDAVKVNADTANLAIESVTLDNGVNFLDTFAALEKKSRFMMHGRALENVSSIRKMWILKH